MKTLKILAIASLTIAITSCEKENNVLQEVSETTLQQEIPAGDLAKLQAMGYRADNISVSSDRESYRVEGDIIVSKEYLDAVEKPSSLAKKGKWWKNHPLACWVVQDVKIYQEGLPGYMVSALEVAVQKWNSVPGSRVNIRYVEKNQQDITIYGMTGAQFVEQFSDIKGPNDVFGVAEIPYWNRPGKRIRVNTTLNTTWEEWVNTFMHEIGHCLGLAHSDQSNKDLNENSDYWAEQIEGVSTDFGFSVMKTRPSPNNVTFSDTDIGDIQKLYGWDDNDNICY